MRIALYQRIVLSRDVPEEYLQRGDVAWLIDYLEVPNDAGEMGCLLEVYNALGESVRVAAVPISAIQPVREDMLPSVRLMRQAG